MIYFYIELHNSNVQMAPLQATKTTTIINNNDDVEKNLYVLGSTDF